jgi:hypothetical protein
MSWFHSQKREAKAVSDADSQLIEDPERNK